MKYKCTSLISFACEVLNENVLSGEEESIFALFSAVRCSCYSQARKPQNLKLHFFKQICHAVIIMFLQKAYFWVVSPYWYPHPMWLVPDWLSFAGVSVPAFLLEETNVVPTNRKRAEADASCLRYARVLTELARLVWKNKNSTLLYFLTFGIVGE